MVIDVHQWLNISSARQEDYKLVQSDLGMVKHKFIKYVEWRWLTLAPAVAGILEQWEALVTYFFNTFTNNQTTLLAMLDISESGTC